MKLSNDKQIYKILEQIHWHWEREEPENRNACGCEGWPEKLGDQISYYLYFDTEEVIYEAADGDKVFLQRREGPFYLIVEHSLHVTPKNSDNLYQLLKEKHPHPWKAFAANIVLVPHDKPNGKKYEVPTLIYGIK